MASGKKSVIIYADWIDNFEALSDDEAGKLIKHFFRYVNDLNPVCPDRITELSFLPIKQSLKRDLVKWEGILEKRSEAGKASAEAKRQAKLLEQTSTNSTSVDSVQQTSTNSTVSVNVNDSVSVSVNDILLKKETKDISTRKFDFGKTLYEFSNTYSKDMLNEFYEYWTEPMQTGNKFRQEKEKSWSLERRLKLWAKNENNFNKSKSKQNGQLTELTASIRNANPNI